MPKSEQEIANRRNVKRRVVNTLIDIAENDPLCANGNGVLSSMAQYKVKDLWEQHLRNNAADLNVLRTAKGCKQPPKGASGEGFKGTTLADFLQWGGEDSTKKHIGCWGGFIWIAYQWALQVIKDNPHTFQKAEAQALKQRVVSAIETAERKKMAKFHADWCKECGFAMTEHVGGTCPF